MRKIGIAVVLLVAALVGGIIQGALAASVPAAQLSKVVQEPNPALLGKHSCTMPAGCSMTYTMTKVEQGYAVEVDFRPIQPRGEAVSGYKRFVVDGDKMVSDGWKYFDAPITIYTQNGKVYLQWSKDPGVLMKP
jgi:hypothetical protein